MRTVEFSRYGAARDVLELVDNAPKPVPAFGEVLINVKAASVNPVDCAIRSGYGREVFKSKGQVGTSAFPMRLGRDAAGVIEAVGDGVTGFAKGDKVFTAPTRAAIAEYISVAANEVAAMPRNLTFVAAAAIPFVAMTTWSALVDLGGLTEAAAPGKRVVIARGAGGVGSFAIQLMKAWGAYVASTCSTGNVAFVKSLGADRVVDYKRERVSEVLKDYDAVFDSAFDMEDELLATLKNGAGASYVTIVSPKVKLADQHGVEAGTRLAEEEYACRAAAQKKLGRNYYWSFMQPNGAALAQVSRLLELGKITPVVDRVYALAQIADAHEYSESRTARGKIVLDFER
ncbi:MAG: zinc-binding dehydrogenase [Rhodobacteraceae bacterium]|nr:zinc-binding dehydrogenase [Paracoccaceae bacterium]